MVAPYGPILPGICSVTFRDRPAEDVIRLARRAGLCAIEWGGDIHAPPGEVSRARDLAARCRDAGLATPSYGSYYRMDPRCHEPAFPAVLETAVALGCRSIRVWPGMRGSRDMDAAYRTALVDELRSIATQAAAAGCEIGLEYHRQTATDTNQSAIDLVHEVAHPSLVLYWQPRPDTPVPERLRGLEMALPHLRHLHVYHWTGPAADRRTLQEGQAEWEDYLRLAATLPCTRCAFLEFVPDGTEASFLRDATTLKKLCTTAAEL